MSQALALPGCASWFGSVPCPAPDVEAEIERAGPPPTSFEENPMRADAADDERTHASQRVGGSGRFA